MKYFYSDEDTRAFTINELVALCLCVLNQCILDKGVFLFQIKSSDEEPWNQFISVFHDTWYVDCPTEVAMMRIFKRQTSNGLAPDASTFRIAYNDRPNAVLVSASKSRAGLIVPSLPFQASRRKG